MKHIRPIDWFFMALLVAWAIFLASLTHARAESDLRWVRRQHCEPTYGYCTWNWVQRRIYYRPYYRRPSYGYRRDYDRRDYDDDDRYDRRGLCKDRSVEIISTEHTTEEHARDAARKLWMASVNWQWGARYMDLDLATDIEWRCGPSSPMDTLSGRIAETANKLVGRDGQNVRCQLWARPCEAPRERDRDRRR